jgi:hypothetical protein
MKTETTTRILRHTRALLVVILMTASLSHATTTITWDPPTSSADGSELPGWIGYRVYHGVQSGTYTEVTDVSNLTSLTLTNLAAGQTHYFAICAYNLSREEGPRSDEFALYLPPAIVLSTTVLTIDEGASASVSVHLETAPLQPTTVVVRRQKGGSRYVGITGGAQLTFTPGNWSAAQTVTLTALRDPLPTTRSAQFDFTANGYAASRLNVTTLTPTLLSTGMPDGQDQDGNGLPDTWEITQLGGLNIQAAAATDDTDHDGLANQQEYIAGTDPEDPASLPQLGIAQLNGRITVLFQTIAATGAGYLGRTRTYTLEHCPDLATASWSPVAAATAITAHGQTCTYTNSDSAVAAAYYRISTQLQ